MQIDCHPVVAQLALLMRSMQSGERAPIKVAAVEFVESVYKALPKFKKGVQQDAEVS